MVIKVITGVEDTITEEVWDVLPVDNFQSQEVWWRLKCLAIDPMQLSSQLVGLCAIHLQV